jgi:hypothetical protein
MFEAAGGLRRRLAISVRRSARHQHEELAFAWRELLEQRRRLERIDARGEGRRDVPGSTPGG